MDLNALRERIEKNGFTAKVFETAEEAAEYLDKEIDNKTVGFGGSATLTEMGMYERLSKHNTVYSHGRSDNPELTQKKAAAADIYMLSVNAIAEDTGIMMNMDGTGNRVASSLYGHEKVYMVAGKNKVSPDFDSALYRLRNVVAPKNAKRLGADTPCAAKADKCYDCDSPDRLCRGLVIYYKQMRATDTEIILINEELGF